MLDPAELIKTLLGWLGGISVTLMLLEMIDPEMRRRLVVRYGVASVLLAAATAFMLYAY